MGAFAYRCICAVLPVRRTRHDHTPTPTPPTGTSPKPLKPVKNSGPAAKSPTHSGLNRQHIAVSGVFATTPDLHRNGGFWEDTTIGNPSKPHPLGRYMNPLDCQFRRGAQEENCHFGTTLSAHFQRLRCIRILVFAGVARKRERDRSGDDGVSRLEQQRQERCARAWGTSPSYQPTLINSYQTPTGPETRAQLGPEQPKPRNTSPTQTWTIRENNGKEAAGEGT